MKPEFELRSRESRKKMGRLRRREMQKTAITEVRQVAGVQTRARARATAAEKSGCGAASPSAKISRLQLRRTEKRDFNVVAALSAENSEVRHHGCCISGGSSIASCEPAVALESKDDGPRSGSVATAYASECVATELHLFFSREEFFNTLSSVEPRVSYFLSGKVMFILYCQDGDEATSADGIDKRKLKR